MDFPGHLKQAGRRNADIMLVPSNDWREIDPWHSHMARLRGVEQGFTILEPPVGTDRVGVHVNFMVNMPYKDRNSHVSAAVDDFYLGPLGD